MESSDVIGFIFQALFLVSGLTFAFSLAYIGISKKQLKKAFRLFKNGERVYIKNSSLGLFDPLLIFYIFLPIPNYQRNSEFYSIQVVRDKLSDLKSTYRAVLFGLIGMIISIAGFILSIGFANNFGEY